MRRREAGSDILTPKRAIVTLLPVVSNTHYLLIRVVLCVYTSTLACNT